MPDLLGHKPVIDSHAESEHTRCIRTIYYWWGVQRQGRLGAEDCLPNIR